VVNTPVGCPGSGGTGLIVAFVGAFD
jgi:hypothetical protein